MELSRDIHPPTLFIIARHLKCKATILFYHPSLSIIMSLSSHQNDSELVHSTVILSLAGHHGSRFIKDLSHSLYAVQCAVCAHHRQSIHSPTTTTTTTKQSINNATHTGRVSPKPTHCSPATTGTGSSHRKSVFVNYITADSTIIPRIQY